MALILFDGCLSFDKVTLASFATEGTGFGQVVGRYHDEKFNSIDSNSHMLISSLSWLNLHDRYY